MTLTRSYANIDIEQLLLPISNDCRGGDVNAYSRELRQQLSELRNPPRSANPDDPEQNGGIDPVDWTQILHRSTESLVSRTKDLRVACHLTEASFYLYGIGGLRDGLQLILRLVQQYWDDLAPKLDPSDPETRCAPLENLLNDPVHGPRLPAAIRSQILLTAGELQLSLLSAMRPSDELTAASIASALRQIPVDHAKRLSSDLDEAIETLDALQQELIDRMSDYAPAFNHLSESLELIRRWYDQAFKQQLQALDTSASEANVTEDIEGTTTSKAARKGVARSAIDFPVEPNPETLVDQSLSLRADAYRKLTEAANVLQRMEPHSPIPYMVHRAVRMGQMPFPKLMSQWVKEETTLEMFNRELGLPSDDLSES